MSTPSAIAVSNPAPGTRPQPLLVFFASDPVCRDAMTNTRRFRKTPFEALDGLAPDLERVVLITSEHLLAQAYDSLRAPNVRIIALSHRRFSDPRLDGAVYAYLPPNVPDALLERMIDNAIDHITLIANRQQVTDRLAGATREISQLNEIGAALSAEHDTGKLLEMILTKSRQITASDAGSLYLVEEVDGAGEDEAANGIAPAAGSGDSNALGSPLLADDTAPGAALIAVKAQSAARIDAPKRLRFKLAQNDSIAIPFRESTMAISESSIAGYVALTGNTVAIEDAYHLPAGVPYKINRKFDEDSGYRTKSILAVPMRNPKGEVVGVLQLLNAKRDNSARLDSVQAIRDQVVPYPERQQQLLTSLASQAAVALENSRLYEAIQRLFEGFVRASVIAIEARDPTTSGHSFRVANLTVALAEAADRADSGLYAGVHFSREEMKEIRYASLLHDFGKVGVREEVLVKARKLYPSQLELIEQRFHFVKRTLENESLRARLDFLLAGSRDQYLAQLPDFEARLTEALKEIDDHFNTICRSNEPTVLPEGNFERLLDIAALHFSDYDGAEKKLLTEDEVRLLSIRKGSLDDAERQQIESHVVHTFNFLQQIPWTQEIRNIPGIARGHHEKLNGKGYPYNLAAPEIPLQTRMMTVSDIFDALCAVDRPYKKAVTLDRALDILGFAVKDGELDGSLLQLFKDAKVYERWKVEPYAY